MKPATRGRHAADTTQTDVRLGLEERAHRYDVVSKLADDLAHEIRNPLNAMVVNLEVLRRRIDAGAQAKAVDLTRLIDHEITRLCKLVDQLVFLMRPPRAETAPTSVDETIEELRLLLETQAAAARVSFELITESNLFTRAPRDSVKFALLSLVTAVYEEGSAPSVLRIMTRPAGEDAAEIAVEAQPRAFSDGSEYTRRARAWVEAVGGSLLVQEPPADHGSATALLRIPASSSFV